MAEKTAGDASKGSGAQDAEVLGFSDVPLPLQGSLKWYQGKRRTFFGALVFTVLGALLSLVLGDLYERYKPWKETDDEFIAKIKGAQQAEFSELKNSLDEIRGSLPADGRSAFRALQSSIANVERDSAGLVKQLDLAKQEIATLRTVAQNRGGVGSGYDFTLAEGQSMDLADGGLLGLHRVSSSGVRVTLTKNGVSVAEETYLTAGKGLEYSGNSAQGCWVSLRSFQDGRPGAAAFSTGCGSRS